MLGYACRPMRTALTARPPSPVCERRWSRPKPFPTEESARSRSGRSAWWAWRGELLLQTDAKAENFPDPTDRASLESNRNFTLRIRDRERKLIVKIKEALTRIDDGTYGNCEECGEKIGRERLEARPVTTLCIDCKSLQEAQERKLRGA